MEDEQNQAGGKENHLEFHFLLEITTACNPREAKLDSVW